METKDCVACAEPIRANAKLCRYCNTDQFDSKYVVSPQYTPIPAAQQLKDENAKGDSSVSICRTCHGEKSLQRGKTICDECMEVFDSAGPEALELMQNRAQSAPEDAHRQHMELIAEQVRRANQRTRPSSAPPANGRLNKRSVVPGVFLALFLVALGAGIYLFVSSGNAQGLFGPNDAKVNNTGTDTESTTSEETGTDADFVMEEEPAVVEEAPAAPTGHYEQSCRLFYEKPTQTYDDLVAGYQPEGVWKQECHDKWVED